MNAQKETKNTIQGRLNVLRKSLVSEENSVQYYQTLIANTPEDTEENIGSRRMYEDLKEEEKQHVEKIQSLIDYWEKEWDKLPENP